jgi:platelet-activating factor acetylhydrolase IB subunit alpha
MDFCAFIPQHSQFRLLTYSQVGHDGWVEALVFHPSGKYLLSAGDDHTIRIWDLKTGRCVRKIDAHAQFVCSMAWGRQPAVSSSTEEGKDAAVGKVGGSKGDAKAAAAAGAVMPINVLATGSFDKVRHTLRFV